MEPVSLRAACVMRLAVYLFEHCIDYSSVDRLPVSAASQRALLLHLKHTLYTEASKWRRRNCRFTFYIMDSLSFSKSAQPNRHPLSPQLQRRKRQQEIIWANRKFVWRQNGTIDYERTEKLLAKLEPELDLKFMRNGVES